MKCWFKLLLVACLAIGLNTGCGAEDSIIDFFESGFADDDESTTDDSGDDMDDSGDDMDDSGDDMDDDADRTGSVFRMEGIDDLAALSRQRLIGLWELDPTPSSLDDNVYELRITETEFSVTKIPDDETKTTQRRAATYEIDDTGTMLILTEAREDYDIVTEVEARLSEDMNTLTLIFPSETGGWTGVFRRVVASP